MRGSPTWLMLMIAGGFAALASAVAVCADPEPSLVIASLPDTIATGEFYVLGNKIEPPYVLDVVRDSLYVNGTLAYPYRDFMEIPEDSVALLDTRARKLGLAMSDSGRTDMEITEAIAEMYRSRPELFSDVQVRSAGWLTRRHVPSGIVALVHCWSPHARTWRPPTLAENVAGTFTYVSYWLRRGSTVFVGEDGGCRAFGADLEGGYPEWVVRQLDTPGQLRGAGGGRADAAPQQ